MDPMSAISLAGTVVQFLEFGIKLVAKTHEIYSSVQGAEVRNIELEAISRNFVALNQRVRNRSRKVCVYAVSEDEKALETLTEQCNKVGEELINALQKAKVQGPHKHWKSARQALKSVVGGDKIDELYNRLKQYREQIVVVLLVITSAKQLALDEGIQGVQDSIVESESRIVDEARQSRFQILNAIRHANYSPNKPEDVSTVSELLSDMVSRVSDKKKREAVLDSLYYPRMQDRREWISEAHKKTFNWALEAKGEHSMPWDDLTEWLRKGVGIYWLSGKAGSGKSTLMKYINQDDRTMKFLQEWASPMSLVFASFYFWNPGTTMQKSQLGLLQSLLYEILSQRPSLIPSVLPLRWQSGSNYGQAKFEWTIPELLNAFNLLSEAEIETKFCFLIDGLDEFDGDHHNLTTMLTDITRTNNIKILASSRPWLVFQDSFQDCPKLTLQDLTQNDIKEFAHDSLYNHPRFSRLLMMEPERAPKLVTEIVNKASGVFLWVYLVVRSLMEGLTNADRMIDLQRRLDVLPEDLEQYFLHILTSLDTFYLRQASQLFRLALEAPKPLTVLTFSYLDEDDPDFALKREIRSISEEEEAIRCEEIERRLNSRCKGLLESRHRRSCDEYSDAEGVVAERVSYEVDFLHRTVRDFLSTPTVQVQLVAPDTAEFNANMTLARAFVAQIKGLRRSSHTESNFQALWKLVFDALYHIGRVGGGIPAEAQVALLDEMDRAASHFRDNAIVKRRCKASAHWVNTGYRFGFQPEWNNDFLTLCVQYNLLPYVNLKLLSGASPSRSGKPLLAFAMINPSTGYVDIAEARPYNAPRVEMVQLLLDKGADPNDMDDKESVWVRCLRSIYGMAAKSDVFFSQVAKSWFEIIRLLLLHGANPRDTCRVSTQPGKLVERVNLHRQKTQLSSGLYSAADIIHIVFGGNASFDIAELEELMDLPDTAQHVRSVSDTYLQLSGLEKGNDVSRSTSSASGSSQNSARSAVSWHRPIGAEVVVPLQESIIPETKATATPVYQVPVREIPSIAIQAPDEPPKQKNHSRFFSWFKEKNTKKRSSLPQSYIAPYAGT